MFRNVAKVAAVATLMLSSAYGCKNFVRVKEDDCKKWMEHVTKVVVDDVKKQAKDCKLEKGAEDEVKEAIQNWVKDDCAKYDGDQYLLQKDHECMMKAESPADIDKCYDAIPQTKTSTTTKKVGKVKIKQKKTSNATTMSKPELAKFVKDQKEALCSGGGDKKDDKKGDDKDDKDE